jgi:hypothetical protein
MQQLQAFHCSAQMKRDAFELAGEEELNLEWFGPYIGIPAQLAYLRDSLMIGRSENDRESIGLTEDEVRAYLIRFLRIVPVGSDLSRIVPRFLVWLLIDEQNGVLRFASPAGGVVIEQVAELYQRVIAGSRVSEREWRVAVGNGMQLEDITVPTTLATRSYAASASVNAAHVALGEARPDVAISALAYGTAYAAGVDAMMLAVLAAAGTMQRAAATTQAEQTHFRVMRDKLLDLLREVGQ